MDLYWFEQITANVPAGEGWLSIGEANYARALRFPKRRADWLLGRWTAKNAVALMLGFASEADVLRKIEIRPGPSGAPEVLWRDAPAQVAISLSHRAGVGVCALASAGVAVGCDIETIEPHGDAFPNEYFTREEQALITNAPTTADGLRCLNLLWSAKESALKALGEGLRVDTRRVIVSLPGALNSANSASLPVCISKVPQGVHWRPLQVQCVDRKIFHGWWSQTGIFLRTVVANPAPHPPVFLEEVCEGAVRAARENTNFQLGGT